MGNEGIHHPPDRRNRRGANDVHSGGARLAILEFESLSETDLRGAELRRANLQQVDRRTSGVADGKVIIASVHNS